MGKNHKQAEVELGVRGIRKETKETMTHQLDTIRHSNPGMVEQVILFLICQTHFGRRRRAKTRKKSIANETTK